MREFGGLYTILLLTIPHNLVCEFYKKPKFKILTNCNCDTRFLKIKIDILDNDVEENADSSQSGT